MASRDNGLTKTSPALDRLTGSIYADFLVSDGSAPRPKRAQRLAAQIAQEIIASGWQEGAVLGSEPELISRYGVSRAVLREACRLLEHHHVASMRRGPGGGLIVETPDAAGVAGPAALYLEHAHVSQEALAEMRITIETFCVEATARNLDERGIELLRDIVVREATDARRGESRHELHLAIADLSGNPAARLFVEILARLTHARADEEGDQPAVQRSRIAASHTAHEKIVEAIVAGDPSLARHRMTRHLQALSQVLRL
jgi:DNA-binding FadR family transcriptional regulator